jgi:DNA modification methylase
LTKWTYGGAFERHPIAYGEKAVFDDGSILQVHNIFEPLPDFMRAADLIFCDPPWNLGNLNSFYTKAERTDYQQDFEAFYARLFECIAKINPAVCYVEVGKQYLAEFIMQMKSIFKSVTFYNSMYYHKSDNHCYVIRGSRKYKRLPLDGMDEEDIIQWICHNEDYNCIGDLCMGRGLVACNAFESGHKFVGTELNPKRLSVALERLSKGGTKYVIKQN